MNEADTCRKSVRPKLESAGWDESPHTYNEQISFTDGRIIVAGDKILRRKQKRADFLLRYTRDFLRAVAEAKSCDRPSGDGMQQAKVYAEILGLYFEYATNGREIIEFDYFTGKELVLKEFPTPDELWVRYRASFGLSDLYTKAEEVREIQKEISIERSAILPAVLNEVFNGKAIP